MFKNGIIPPIISNDNKMIYNQALNKAQKLYEIIYIFMKKIQIKSDLYFRLS